MESVYVETSVISYLAAHTSREMIVAAHQAVGWEWWQTARSKHVLYVSQAVIKEMQVGDADQIRRRLELIDGLPVLAYSKAIGRKTPLVGTPDVLLGTEDGGTP